MLASLILEWPPPLARSIPHFCKKAVHRAACKGEQLGASKSVLGVNLEPRGSKMTISIKEENIYNAEYQSVNAIYQTGTFSSINGTPPDFYSGPASYGTLHWDFFCVLGEFKNTY